MADIMFDTDEPVVAILVISSCSPTVILESTETCESEGRPTPVFEYKIPYKV